MISILCSKRNLKRDHPRIRHHIFIFREFTLHPSEFWSFSFQFPSLLFYFLLLLSIIALNCFVWMEVRTAIDLIHTNLPEIANPSQSPVIGCWLFVSISFMFRIRFGTSITHRVVSKTVSFSNCRC